MKKVKEDTDIEVKVEETNDECKITIIDEFYSIVMKFLVRECYGSPKKHEF